MWRIVCAGARRLQQMSPVLFMVAVLVACALVARSRGVVHTRLGREGIGAPGALGWQLRTKAEVPLWRG